MDSYHLADSVLAQRSERDLRRMVARFQKAGLSSEEIKEYFVIAIPKALTHVSVKQPKAGYKKS